MDKSRKEIKIASGEETVIPVAEERLSVEKRSKITGITRISKTVQEKVIEIDEPLREDEVSVERVPINRYVDRPVPIREEKGKTIVPVLEEVLVTEKKLLLREEIHISRATRTVHRPQKITLRSEQAKVEHLPKENVKSSAK